MTHDDSDGVPEDLIHWWECAECGTTGGVTVRCCPECSSLQIGRPSDESNIELPPCWTETMDRPNGADRLFVHLDGPGFIGVEAGQAKLVTADIRSGETPNPRTMQATETNVRTLAEDYNDEVFAGSNRTTEGGDENPE